MKLWIVGQFHESNANWEFQGAFTTEEKAVAACTTDLYFIGPCNADEPIPHERLQWPGCYYPKTESRPEPVGLGQGA